MAIAAGCTLAEAREAYLVHEKKRGNWKGGTRKIQRALALRDLGVQFKAIESFGSRYGFLTRCSLKSFCENHTIPGKRYIVTTTGHVQIVRGNEVTDQQGKTTISDYWGKGKIIKDILEIIE